MAESDFDSKLDEMERDNLQRTISEVERARAAARPDARSFFETFLLNARGRVSQLDKKIKDSQEARETQAREQAAVAALAQKESALSAREKETYSGFLKEDFFTKKDFGRLEQFYGGAWDRLSESGKAQMSHRFWEGIRHHEYTFDQLPPKVREKETEQAYKRLKDSSIGVGDAARIPEKDRDDLIRAYESGHREEASKILGRDSFRENLFRGPESEVKRHAAVEKGRELDAGAVESRNSGVASGVTQPPPAQKSGTKADLDISALNLNGLKMAEAPAQTSVADMPSAATAKGWLIR